MLCADLRPVTQMEQLSAGAPLECGPVPLRQHKVQHIEWASHYSTVTKNLGHRGYNITTLFGCSVLRLYLEAIVITKPDTTLTGTRCLGLSLETGVCCAALLCVTSLRGTRYV